MPKPFLTPITLLVGGLQLIIGIALIASPAKLVPASLSHDQAILLLGAHISVQALILGIMLLTGLLFSKRPAFLGTALLIAGLSNLADSLVNFNTPGIAAGAQVPVVVTGILSLLAARVLLKQDQTPLPKSGLKHRISAYGLLLTVFSLVVAVQFAHTPLWSAPAGISSNAALNFLSYHQSTLDLALSLSLLAALFFKRQSAIIPLLIFAGLLHLLDGIVSINLGAPVGQELVTILLGVVALSTAYLSSEK